jgi:hypothetical protein
MLRQSKTALREEFCCAVDWEGVEGGRQGAASLGQRPDLTIEARVRSRKAVLGPDPAGLLERP